MTKLKPSEMETSWQYYVAAWDELRIEKELFKIFKFAQGNFKENKRVEAQQTALREIDRLKKAETYEVERETLRERILHPQKPGRKINLDPVFLAKFQTYLDGLNSPDPEIRAAFEAFEKAGDLHHKTPREGSVFIRMLEPKKNTDTRGKGRPKSLVPWEKVTYALDEIRVLIGQGLDLPSASMKVAKKEIGPTDLDNRARYFRKLYKERQKLRE